MQARNGTGIDISHYNTVTDWAAVKDAGVQFVYAKASEGTTMKDDKFLSHVNGAHSVGLPIGAYHFAHPENGDAKGEADNFIAQLERVQYDLIPVLDLEWPSDTSKITVGELVEWAGEWINYVKAATNTTVMVYTGNWFINLYQDLWQAFTPYPLWISNYQSTIAPPDSGGWDKWAVWQYASDCKVPGIPGEVDINVVESLDAIRVNPPQQARAAVSADDANKLIGLLSQTHLMLPTADTLGKDELHRLANVLRTASGQPTTTE